MKWDYPLVRRSETLTAIIEPIVGVYAGPSSGNNRRIPDEDSLNFEFREFDLFRPDRLAGYDLLDTGQRVDYGLKIGLYDKDGGNYHILIGQSLRAEPTHFCRRHRARNSGFPTWSGGSCCRRAPISI